MGRWGDGGTRGRKEESVPPTRLYLIRCWTSCPSEKTNVGVDGVLVWLVGVFDSNPVTCNW
ncbi:hypothetical protein VF10_34985, partial [Nostoc linckia z13]|uniref:hypothetical protein n=1 Tax=Nostoc linckia TaxID=92942 RepID=UPI000C02FC0B